MPKFNLTWLYFAIIAVMAIMLWRGTSNPGSSSKDVSYSELKQYIAKGYSNDITVDKGEGQVSMVIRPEYIRTVFQQSAEQVGGQPRVQARYPSADRVEDYLTTVGYKGKVTYEESHDFFLNILSTLLPLLLLIGFWFFMFRGMGNAGGGLFGVGKSKAKEYNKDEGVKVTFKDVAGQEGAKQEVQEIVDFLKNPDKYTELGGKIPKGALLVGPPGTGKTLLAKAVAGEAGVPFFSMSGSDFVEMFVGVGASRVRDLFQKAKEKAPSIVFIDEIDAVGRARSKGTGFGGNDERENTLNQLLTEMDGFGTNSGVIILAATNRVDVLDQALLRAGRFDRQIYVDLPDLPERIAIFNVHLRPLKLQPGLDIELLARQTPGFSGADIANVCNEAALIAARKDKTEVEKQDFLDAIDRIVGGLERKSKILTPQEKEKVAYHEAGHATVSWLLEHASPLLKVSIIPRGRSLGAAWYVPEERQLTTVEQMFEEMCALMGGRAAEDVVFGELSTGALNDLERVNKMAYGLVAYYGMAEGLENACYFDSTGQSEFNFAKPYSEQTAQRIDAAVAALRDRAYNKAKEILTAHRDGLDRLANRLLTDEVIFADDLEAIYGPRKGETREEMLQSSLKQEAKDEEQAKVEEEGKKAE